MLTVRGKRPAGPLVLLLIALCLPGWANASKLLYRYYDDKGVPNIDHRVPPEFAKNGYTVMRQDGTVIEVVPRQLTAEEMKDQGSAEARRRAAEAEAKRLQEWDESLLRRYSTTADIEAARDRAMRDFEVRINILRSNLMSVKGQIEREQAKAADIERRGAQVPAETTQAIASLRREISDTEDSIAQNQREQKEARASYQRDIERFTTLKDIVEWRRSAGGGGRGESPADGQKGGS